MQVLLVEFFIKRGFEAAFEQAIRDNASASLALEPGCRQFDVCTHPERPGHFVLYELYDDDAAVAAHLAAPHFLHLNALTAEWVQDKRVWRGARLVP